MNVILCSNSIIKKSVVRKWLRKDLYYSNYNLKGIRIHDISLPDQPINSGGLACCKERIKYIEKNYPEEVSIADMIISIENSLVISSEEIKDVVNIVIKNNNTNEIFEHVGGEIVLDYQILDDYPQFMNIMMNNIFSCQS